MSSSINNGFHITCSPIKLLGYFGSFWANETVRGQALLGISWRKENLKCFLVILSSCINYCTVVPSLLTDNGITVRYSL